MRARGKAGVFVLSIAVVAGIFLLATGCAKKAGVPDEGAAAPRDEYVKPAPTAPATESKGGGARGLAELARGLEDIHFDYDKYNIRPDARDALKKNAGILTELKGAQVVIQGHCDDRGSTEYNLALGQRRADAALDYVVSLGIDRAMLSTISYGEERPVDPGQNEDAWAKNRRAHFSVSGAEL
jgi:peptidoglycan-associated lipoprotein